VVTVTVPRDPLRSREEKAGGCDLYRLPNCVCASCGKSTGGWGTGYGPHHYDCARDAKGCLLVIADNKR
jgi:hypothetical protein